MRHKADYQVDVWKHGKIKPKVVDVDSNIATG